MSKIQVLTIISLAFSSMSFAFSIEGEGGEGYPKPTFITPSELPKVPNIGSETLPRLPTTTQNPDGGNTSTFFDPTTNKPLSVTITSANKQVISQTMLDPATGKPVTTKIVSPNGSSTSTSYDVFTNKPLSITITNAKNQVISQTMFDPMTGKPLENQVVNPNGTITRTSFSLTGTKLGEYTYKGTQILPQSPSSNKPSIP